LYFKDENIHPSKVAGIIGEKYAKQMEEAALKVYKAVSCPYFFYYYIWIY